MSLLGRMIVIFLALIAAAWASGIVMSMALLGPQWHGFTGDIGERASFWVTVVFASSYTGGILFVPLLVFIGVAESFAWRSPLLYATVGAALLLAGYFHGGYGAAESVDDPPAGAGAAHIAAAGGVVFGFVYWAIAGRKAGAWRARRRGA
ncbi:MAG TPA: hypothetical protein VFA53_01270 [Xanthobacteraceae bacterium]|nr:hypothetical protein [Xanthobacteraceae bacterium]